MRLAKYLKTPAESKRYTIDYSHWLDTGEYVDSVVFDVISTNEGTLTLVGEAIAPSATTLEFFALGGNAGQKYEVSVQMSTDAGQVKEDTIIFQVEDP